MSQGINIVLVKEHCDFLLELLNQVSDESIDIEERPTLKSSVLNTLEHSLLNYSAMVERAVQKAKDQGSLLNLLKIDATLEDLSVILDQLQRSEGPLPETLATVSKSISERMSQNVILDLVKIVGEEGTKEEISRLTQGLSDQDASDTKSEISKFRGI